MKCNANLTSMYNRETILSKFCGHRNSVIALLYYWYKYLVGLSTHQDFHALGMKNTRKNLTKIMRREPSTAGMIELQCRTSSTILQASIWYNLPYLVISLVPLPQHNSSTVLDATGFLIAMESIDIEANVVNHSYSSVPITDFLALAP